MKLYTKQGDDGTTLLFGGERTSKDDLRVEAYGTVDELNSALGLLSSRCRFDEIRDVVRALQERLFELGADLAAPESVDHQANQVPRVKEEQVQDLEKQIDAFCARLPPLTRFILPGGSDLAARLHMARTVCRRAERCCVRLGREQRIGTHVIVFLNRLGDLLFAMARRANQLENVADVPWPGNT